VPTSSKVVLAGILSGGRGEDTFIYGEPTGGDTITDFGGNDIFQISAGFGGGLEKELP